MVHVQGAWRRQLRRFGWGSLVAMLAACATSPPAPVVPERSNPSPTIAPSQPAAPPSGASAAQRNAWGLYNLPFDLFGRSEVGWAVYAPRVGQTVGVTARADGEPFAAALAGWQSAHGFAATGVMDEATLRAMKAQWQSARPFLAARAAGVCPAPPTPDALALADPRETHFGKAVQLRAGALAAYRRMVAAARATGDPRLGPPHFQIFSGYRDPAYDAQRCAIEGNCQGVVRAACSAHRTGLAMDLVLDTLPGARVDDSADPNRLAMERGYAYRWLLANAARFGFVNYAFEPWHWEWTGEPVEAAPAYPVDGGENGGAAGLRPSSAMPAANDSTWPIPQM